MRLHAHDGAVITVDPDEPSGGWAVNCTTCKYIAVDDDVTYVNQEAAHHHGWHNAELARVQSYL